MLGDFYLKFSFFQEGFSSFLQSGHIILLIRKYKLNFTRVFLGFKLTVTIKCLNNLIEYL